MKANMFANKQVETLFDKINALNASACRVGFDAVRTSVSTVDLWNLTLAAKQLKELQQQLMLGTHEHNYGGGNYLFVVPKGVEFGKDELKKYLQASFEPELGEFLNIELMDEPTVVLQHQSEPKTATA